jgi:hypothetical protein
VDPVASSATAGRTLKQVVALAAYKNAIQTYEHFSEKREQDGGTRFKGTEYVQDFSYDVWVIDQLSEGVVPLFLPDTLDNLQVVDDSFTFVAAQVAAARSQLGVSPETYPLSGPETLKSTPEWFHSPYNATANLDTEPSGAVGPATSLTTSDRVGTWISSSNCSSRFRNWLVLRSTHSRVRPVVAGSSLLPRAVGRQQKVAAHLPARQRKCLPASNSTVWGRVSIGTRLQREGRFTWHWVTPRVGKRTSLSKRTSRTRSECGSRVLTIRRST